MNASRLNQTLFVALGLLAVAVAAPFPAQEQIRDSLFWARVVENGNDLYSLLNPHHLAYLPINLFLYKLIVPVCHTCSGITAGIIHSLAAYALAVAGLYLLIRELTGSVLYGVLAALLLLFSEILWVYSTQVGPYVPTVASLVWLAYFMARLEIGVTAARLLGVIAFFAFAVLYHQATVVLSLPIALFFVARNDAAKLRHLVIVLSSAGILVLAAYLAAYGALYDTWSIPRLVEYGSRYSTIPIPTFSTLNNFTLHNLKLILQLHLEGFATPPWRLRDPAAYGFAAAVAVLVFWHARVILSGGRLRNFRLFCLVWLLLVIAVFLWANPTEKEYLSINYVPLLALFFLALNDVSARHGKLALALAGLSACLIVFAAQKNFTHSILPMAKTKGAHYAWAGDIASITPAGCKVFHQNQLVLQNLIYYFPISIGPDLWDILNYHMYAQGRPLPFGWTNFHIEKTSCFVVPADVISPSTRITIKTGYELPDEWLDAMRWLFGFEEGGPAGSFTVRRFSAVRDGSGRLYFVVRNDRTSPLSGTAWMASLDKALSRVTGKPQKRFGPWLESSCGRLSPRHQAFQCSGVSG